MPLNLMDLGVEYTIQKILGKENRRHHLENLGFIVGETVRILSCFNSYYVVCVKDTKVGLSEELAKLIIVTTH